MFSKFNVSNKETKVELDWIVREVDVLSSFLILNTFFLIFTCSKLTIERLEKTCEISSKLTIKIPEQCQWRCYGVDVVSFEKISHPLLLFLLLFWTSRFLLSTIRNWFIIKRTCNWLEFQKQLNKAISAAKKIIWLKALNNWVTKGQH